MAVSISAAVGIRNGVQMMPNTPGDLAKITDLFDRIHVRDGGTMEIGGLWQTERMALISELAAQIVTFQTTNNRPIIDGAIDRDGGTLREMNRLADSGPGPSPSNSAEVVATGRDEDYSTQFFAANVATLPGLGLLMPESHNIDISRRLVRIDGCSIKWFGVVVPATGQSQSGQSVPHIHFTPTPIQGGYADSQYESFNGWMQLWADYTDIPGGQMAGAGADHILVTPFYKTAQAYTGMGDFLNNWRQVVSAVIAAAINSIDPLRLRDGFEFDRIVSSSFSNGYVAHKQFYEKATGAADMTDVLFDLDGVAGGSTWRPPKGVIYLNRQPPALLNPVGANWYVGGRWQNFAPFYGGNLNTHACCRNHLLYHALWQYCT